MGAQFDRLKQRLATVHNLNRANSVLNWDEQTYMPLGGAAARGEQSATLTRIAHEIFTDPATEELLEAAAEELHDFPAESDEVSLVRVARRLYDRERKLPAELVAQLARHTSAATQAWLQAREEQKYQGFAPYLGEMIVLQREAAERLEYDECLYDALLDGYEPGMKTSQVVDIFAALRQELVPLARTIMEHDDRVNDAVLYQPFDEAGQEAFAVTVVKKLGYDFSRGRIDRAVHPFETPFSINDVRITTHVQDDFLNPALFGTIHEAGHAVYEQGIDEALEGTILAQGASLGVHESQSRMWENVVGRSLNFWEYFYPQLQAVFPTQLQSIDLATFYGAINHVERSYIRIEADELTYNLHIMLRFEMEMDLLEGRYPVAEAPDVWNAKMHEYFGIHPPNDTLGILQDIHWADGLIGYFPTYTLGNILSVQFYDAAVRALPEIPEQIRQGEFDGLLGWLTEHLYRYGRKFRPNELIERATGEPMRIEPYLAYLKSKYGEIYGTGPH